MATNGTLLKNVAFTMLPAEYRPKVNHNLIVYTYSDNYGVAILEIGTNGICRFVGYLINTSPVEAGIFTSFAV